MSEQGWTAIWHNGWPEMGPPPETDLAARVVALTLCLELTTPPPHGNRPLCLWHGDGGVRQAVGLYLMPGGVMRLVHGEVDLSTPADFARAGDTILLRYRACARGRDDVLDLCNPDRLSRVRLRAAVEQPLRLADAMPGDPRYLSICHIAGIAPFGVAPTDVPGLASGTPVLTSDGPVAVENLRPGVRVRTADGTAAPLRWVEARARLSLGRQAPILLRAPYFGLHHDICVTPETRIVRTGPTVEYICGADRVLVEAGNLIGTAAAQRLGRRPVQTFHHLMLDDHDCILVDRCPVETALLSDVIRSEDRSRRPALAEKDCVPCLPVLDRAGAQALAFASARGRRALG